MGDREPLGWQAVEIGPGALDPLLIRPYGAAPVASPPRPVGPVPAHVTAFQPAYLEAPTPAEPPKEPSRWRRIRSGPHFGTWVIGVIVAVIMTTVIWATATAEKDDFAVGDCLSLGSLLPAEVACDSPDAEFRVITRYDGTDYERCASDAPDAGLTVSGAVLCVNYVARVGDCLYYAEGSSVGKEPCTSSEPGLFQVVEVVSNSLDTTQCPDATDEVIVHRQEFEVICLVENP